MALLKFIGGIRLSAALVKCGITLAVALLDLTAGVILTAKKVARAWEAHSDSGRTSTMYLHGRRVVREVWLPRATNIQEAYVDYVPFLFSLATFFLCEDNKPIDLVILYCVVMPFYPSSTKRHETRSLATDFFPFQPRCGFNAYFLGQYSLPSFPYSTQTWISLHEVGFPLIVQIKGFICVTSRAE